MSKTLAEWSAGNGVRPPVVAVAAWKGGDGKSTFARELAYLLGGVLADFDWDLGGSTRSMGYRHENYVRAPLLDAFSKNRTPSPIRGNRKADLLPSHPDWQHEQPDRDTITDTLYQWVTDWRRPGVFDTHPGGSEATYGAVNGADVVVVPAVLTKESLNALDGMLDELSDYPLLVVPNKIKAPKPWARKKLRELVTEYNVPVGPKVDFYPWLEQRTRNYAVCSEPVPQRARPFVDQMDQVVDRVINYGA